MEECQTEDSRCGCVMIRQERMDPVESINRGLDTEDRIVQFIPVV